MMKWLALPVAAGLALAQQSTDSPTGNRTTPPTLMAVTPLGVSRGATVELTIEGFNLANASAIHFSEPGIQARIVRIKELPDLPDIRLGANGTPSTIDLGPLPPRNQVTLELDISPEAHVGPVSFRLQTPLGASPEGKILIEPYYGESPDREPNDTAEQAFESYLPTILVGTISRPGDVDYYKIAVKDGDEIVFENAQVALGSALQPVISIFSEDLGLVRELGASDAAAVAHRFAKGGAYYLRIADYQQGGSANHFYRIKVGKLPLALSAYPLGVERGKTARVQVAGFNLARPAVEMKGVPTPEDERAIVFRPAGASGDAFNRLRLAIGENPEVEAAPGMLVTPPVTVNGRLDQPEQIVRFRAKKGEKLVVEVMANRLGSRLDSVLEVLDSAGKPIERATVRCLAETYTVLRDHDSAGGGIRVQSPAGFAVGDWVLMDNEIMRIEALPRTPDDDVRMESFGGQRMAYFDTTSEAHAVDSKVYKVQIHPPGAQFASNGLPLVRLAYRNDDGGPGYGKDSRLRFTAPADGEYRVRLRDVRGLKGEDFAYRLMIQPPQPDFRLSVSPRNPNVPLGGRIPLTVTAIRMDDFEGPIDVTVDDLPPGVHATKGAIGAGQVSTVVLLAADPDAKLERSAPLKVAGRAGSQHHLANPEDSLKLISLMPKPDLFMTAETKAVTLEPGGTAEVAVSIRRNNQFGGRVPVQVMNLPPGVRVLDVGLNGVLINEDENRRTFTLEALPLAQPVEQEFVVGGLVETRAGGQQTIYAAESVKVRVKPRTQISSVPPSGAAERATAAR